MRHSTASRYSIIESHVDRGLASFAEEVEAGLASKPRSIPCRFLYDALGSRLFEEICELPEYYPTRAEAEILEERCDEIAGAVSGPATLAELGSGSSTKTRLLIEAFLRRHGSLRYVPVDISHSMLEASARDLLDHYDDLEVRAIASEYGEGLRHVGAETDRPKLIAWLGSSLGNLERSEAVDFLANVRSAMTARDRVLLGVDLRKRGDVLERAYDDSQGVTARFTLNVLERINRELGGEFDLEAFEHEAVYWEVDGCVAIHAVSLRDQSVAIRELDLEIELARGEKIHIENSYKYSLAEIEQLVGGAGLRVDRTWTDHRDHFSLNLLLPEPAD